MAILTDVNIEWKRAEIVIVPPVKSLAPAYTRFGTVECEDRGYFQEIFSVG